MFYRVNGWDGFCGGRVLSSFQNAHHPHKQKAEGETAIEKLISIAANIDEASFVMADAEFGVAEASVFSGLDSEGKIEVEDAPYTLGYTLSPFFYNPNSGNQCRVLFVWKEYTEEWMEEQDREREGEEYNEPQDYEEDYDDC